MNKPGRNSAAPPVDVAAEPADLEINKMFRKLNGQRNGNYLSNPFRIASGVAELKGYAATTRKKSVFISYKRCNHRGDERRLRLERASCRMLEP